MDNIQVNFLLSVSFQKTTFHLTYLINDYRLSEAYFFGIGLLTEIYLFW